MRAVVVFLCAVMAGGCGDDRDCTYDVDCPVGERCVATRCVPVQLSPLRDAQVGDGSTDAQPPRDSGPDLDGGVDASVDPDCTLSMVPGGGVQVSTAAGSDETPLLARSGLLFGVVVRQEPGLMATYFDEDGTIVLAVPDPIDAGAAVGDFAITTESEGSLVAVWHGADDRLHGGIATADAGIVSLGDLTEPAAGTITPAIARTSTGFVIAWSDRADGTDLVGTRSLDAAGVPVGDAVRTGTPPPARLPALADVGGSDRVPLAWNDGRSGTPQPYAATRMPDGTLADAIEVSSATLAGRVAAVMTPFGLFLSWIEPPGVPGDQGSVHVSRIEQGVGRDNVIAQAFTLDSRTSIAWDGDRLFVAWHRGAIDGAEATVAAVRPDLQRIADMSLGAGTARPSVAADATLRGVAWIDADTSNVMFGMLSCDP